MFIQTAVALALVAAPDVDFQGGLTSEAAGGITPQVPGAAAGGAVSIEAIPSVGVRIFNPNNDFSIVYNPRIFYRRFLEGDVQLDAPLILHGAGLNYSRRFSRRWRMAFESTFSAGEVDFQDAASAIAPGGGSVGRQPPAAQVLSSLTAGGSLSVTGELTRRTTWTNAVNGSYSTPLGDIEVDNDGNALVGVLPETAVVGYDSSVAYRLNRRHSFGFNIGYTLTTFQATDETGNPSDDLPQQAFHSTTASLQYAWLFDRDSSVLVGAGAQLAIGDADAAAGVVGDGETDFIPLPIATLGLSWVPINTRDVSVSNVITAAIEGSADPTQGTFQPRLSVSVDFQINVPRDLTIGLVGTLSMPLEAPPAGQAVNVAGGAGDSQVDVSLPITYRFTDEISASVGARFGYFFTQFGVGTVDDGGDPVEDMMLDNTITAEGFLSLSVTFSTLSGETRSLAGTVGGAGGRTGGLTTPGLDSLLAPDGGEVGAPSTPAPPPSSTPSSTSPPPPPPPPGAR